MAPANASALVARRVFFILYFLQMKLLLAPNEAYIDYVGSFLHKKAAENV